MWAARSASRAGRGCAPWTVSTSLPGEPRLRSLQEPRPGLSHARNRGCQTAQGDLLAFLDDDEIAPPQWLSTLVRSCEQTGADGVGGPYQPLWQAPPPQSPRPRTAACVRGVHRARG